MADVFISYAHEDHEFVEVFAAALEAKGLSVWWDRNIEAGKTFDKEIDQELAAAKFVVAAWSSASVNSRWVREEANDALELGKLIPIRIENISLPRGFKLIQTIDMLNGVAIEENPGWAQLIQRLRYEARAKTNSETEEEEDAASQLPEPVQAVTAPEYYDAFHPKRFTIVNAVYLGVARFCLTPFTYLLYSLIYLFVPFYGLTYIMEWLFFEALSGTSSLLQANSTFISVSLLNTYIIYTLSLFLQAQYSVKIRSEAFGMRQLKMQLGEVNSKFVRIVTTSLFIALIFTALDTIYKLSDSLKSIMPDEFSQSYPAIYSVIIAVDVLIQVFVTVLLIRFGLAPCVAAIEGRNFWFSMKRSRELIRGHAWRFSALHLIILLIGVIVYALCIPAIWPVGYDIAYLTYLSFIAENDAELSALTNELAQKSTLLLLVLTEGFENNRIHMALAWVITIMIGSLIRTEAFFQIYAHRNSAPRQNALLAKTTERLAGQFIRLKNKLIAS